MRRYAAFDPPEYLEWSPDPLLVEMYRNRIEADQERADLISGLSEDILLGMYRELLRTRILDICLKRWVRQGVISKAWLGTGEEAVTVGSVAALDREHDVVCPMIRNAGACHMMGMTLASLFRGYLATPDSPSEGRDLHVGEPSSGVISPVSPMGTNIPVMAGVGLSFRNRGEPRVALTWIGDGATKSGQCHEGLNFAAVQNLPVVFVLQDNRVALGTRAEQHGIGELARWGDMYGIPTWKADGNHVLDVYAATLLAAEECRQGRGPGLVFARTFRMGGHATHDEREARDTFSSELFEEWGRRDPIGLYEVWLGEQGIPAETLEEIEQEVTDEVEAAAEEALKSRALEVDPAHALLEGISDGPVLRFLEQRPV